MTNRKIQYGAIPPDADAESVAALEEVPDSHEEPHDADFSVVCMDEQPVLLHKEIRTPIAAPKKHAYRVDCEYERCGNANIFTFTEPSAGWRDASVREHRTKVDWAWEIENF